MSIKVFSIARLKIDNKDFILQDFSAIEEEYNEQLQQNEKNRVIKKAYLIIDLFRYILKKEMYILDQKLFTTNKLMKMKVIQGLLIK